MELKKLHMGTLVFGWDSMDEVATLLASTLGDEDPKSQSLLDTAQLWLTDARSDDSSEELHADWNSAITSRHVLQGPRCGPCLSYLS